jgi:hypothetical protein
MPGEEQPRERPRPWLLATLGVALVALLGYWMWPSASPSPAPSNQARDRRARQTAGQTTPESLEVRLGSLTQPPPEPSDAERNPFRFQPKPPPAPPPSAFTPPPSQQQPPPVQPPQPVGPPPIPLKYFALIDAPGGKIAGLTDGRAVYKGREGDTIEGRYRIVKIGVESVVMEYLDGSGRQTIPLRGQ